MSKITYIKVADVEMIKTVASLAKEIWNEYFTPIIGKAQVDYMLEKFQSEKAISQQITKEGFLYYLIKQGNNFIGYTAVVPKKETNELFLSKLYLKSSQRQKGHGKEAIQFINNLAEKMKFSKITLTVNKNNKNTIQAYEKMGLKNIASLVTDIGDGFVMDDYRMEKIIV